MNKLSRRSFISMMGIVPMPGCVVKLAKKKPRMVSKLRGRKATWKIQDETEWPVLYQCFTTADQEQFYGRNKDHHSRYFTVKHNQLDFGGNKA